MTTRHTLHLVPTAAPASETAAAPAAAVTEPGPSSVPHRPARLRPEERRREPVQGRRPRLAVMSRQGRGSLLDDDVLRLAKAADVTFHTMDEAPDRAAAIRLLQGVEVLAATNRCLPVLDETLLAAVPTLRGVVLHATGYDHIDVELLEGRGVGLDVLPDYATQAVAEHALAMVLGLATRLHLAHDRSRGLVPETTSLRGVELGGRTLGVVGYGRIGSFVADLARGLGMRVVATDIDPAAVVWGRRAGVPMVDLPTLLAESDAVVMCASHAFERRPILSTAELEQLRPGSLVANVARAALVDTDAAVAAVRSGRLRGYAVDDTVIDPEVDGDLLAEGRVLQTGHSAWWRDEALERGRRMWGSHVLAALDDQPLGAVTWPSGASRLPLEGAV